MAKVLVICARRYNGHELWTLLKRLRVHGHTFEVVSSQTLIRDELSMQPNTIERTLYDFDEATEISGEEVGVVDEQTGESSGVVVAENPIDYLPEKDKDNKDDKFDKFDKFDGVCVVSGNMSDTEAYWTDEKVISILRAFKARKKMVAAICCSVPTLAPICKGVRVTPFPLVRSRHRLLQHGAILEPVSICVDPEHRVVTAENQMMSYLWGDTISAVLQGKVPELDFTPTKYADRFSGRTPRRLPKDLEEQLVKFRPTPATIYPKKD